MECKFLQNGISVAYDHVVKPCCIWKYDQHYRQQNHAKQVNLINWHDSTIIKDSKELLKNNTWPENCRVCQNQETQKRYDSIRLSGLESYKDYNHNDITLEIRPGNVCNFACQTCWPEASSRVEQFQYQAKMIDRLDIDSSPIIDFNFLLPIASRIKDVVLLGGEPFYDKNCRRFLSWAADNLSANIIMYTNGSLIDWDWINDYPGKITLVFSMDAIGRPAEYVRFGTNWETVYNNFQQCLDSEKVDTRVNVTLSVYNYHYVADVIDLLTAQWPSTVTFGTPIQPHLVESVIPQESRSYVIDKINTALITLLKHKNYIETNQWHNAINALKSVIDNLKNTAWDQTQYEFLLDYINRLDSVKNCKIQDYCPDTVKILNLPV